MGTGRRILTGVMAFLVLLTGVALFSVWWVGAWNILFPSHVHETEPPEIPGDLGSPAVLLFTKTNSFRHTDGIRDGSELFRDIAERRGWSVFATENSAIMNDRDLARFDAVVFHNATGDIMSDAQEASFRSYLEGGGGWLGTHAAGDGSHEGWDWYVDTVIGVPYIAHTMGPQFQEATVFVEAPDHPATRDLPERWSHTEEWYSWSESPRGGGVRVLVSVDESTYTPHSDFLGSYQDLRMGDHPIVWIRCVDRGRVFYSGLGHAGEAYQTPEMRSLLEGGMVWVMGEEGPTCEELDADAN